MSLGRRRCGSGEVPESGKREPGQEVWQRRSAGKREVWARAGGEAAAEKGRSRKARTRQREELGERKRWL